MRLINKYLQRKAYLTALFIMMSLGTFCQVSELLIVESNEKFKRVNHDVSYSHIIGDRNDDVFFFSTKFSGDDGIRKVFTNYNNLDTVYFEKTKKLNSFHREILFSISITKEFVIFLTSSNIYFFSYPNEKGEMFVEKVIKNDKNFHQTYLLNDDKLFLSVFYNFHPGDQRERHLWGILDLNKQKIVKIQRMSDNDVHFSHFVNDLVDVKDKKIMLSESSSYKIFFFVEEFNKIDSISSEELDEKNNKHFDNEELFNNLESKDAISNFKSLDDSLFTRIRKVFFLDTNNVMVILKLAGQESLRVDYWEKSDEVWKRKIVDSSSVWFEQGQQYNSSMYCYTDFYQNVSSIIPLGDNRFGLFYYPYIETLETKSFDKQRDYFLKQNKNIQNENTFIGFKTIRINISDDKE